MAEIIPVSIRSMVTKIQGRLQFTAAALSRSNSSERRRCPKTEPFQPSQKGLIKKR
jgi:hypothetical protein